jgi:hypothetical protein
VSFVDTSKEKQNQEDIIALKNEILELKGPLKNYAINRVLKPVEQFRKSWKKSRPIATIYNNYSWCVSINCKCDWICISAT